MLALQATGTREDSGGFWRRIFLSSLHRAGERKEFSDKHARIIEEAYQEVANIFGVRNGVIAGLFRIGDGGEPSARSPKTSGNNLGKPKLIKALSVSFRLEMKEAGVDSIEPDQSPVCAELFQNAAFNHADLVGVPHG